MRGFDLYRVTLGYLAVIFVLCAVVVFDPLRWVRPAPSRLAVPDIAAPVLVDARPARDLAPAETAQAAPPTVVDELVAMDALLASIMAEDQSEVGEGDASATDLGLSPESALVARGSDVAYTVGVGDSLGALALRFYGDSALAGVIFQANRGLMLSPDRLRVGQVLIIPGRS